LKELKTQIDFLCKDQVEKAKNEGKRIVIEDTDGSGDEEQNIELNRKQEKNDEIKKKTESKEVVKRQIKVTEVESDNEDDEELDKKTEKQINEETQNKTIELTKDELKSNDNIPAVNKMTTQALKRRSYELPKNLTHLKDQANQAFSRGQYDEAMRHYNHIIEQVEENGNYLNFFYIHNIFYFLNFYRI
jgi:hypothetical protein